MTPVHYDVAVVGAGPAGSVAALILARGGARVALVDKATFPRDKACGDLVGPRGVQTLAELGVLPAGRRLGDMHVAGPGGHRVLLRASGGSGYPGYALAVRRHRLDAHLRAAALDAGADGVTGRAAAPHFHPDGELDGFRVESGAAGGLDLRADVVVGADGALSHVGAVAGMVDRDACLWGFAVRGYGPVEPALPRISFWEPSPWHAYPGYGWEFPGDGSANVGLGAGSRGTRRRAGRAAKDLDAFAASLAEAGRLDGRLGGWLKLGMIGTDPARGRTLLVGDAAGLVNPLQGEGISQALGSGRAAATAVLAAGPAGAADHYRRALARHYAAHASATAPIVACLLRHPFLTAALARTLTAPGVGSVVAGGWALYWNDLVDGAPPGLRRLSGTAASHLGRLVTRRSRDRRALWETLGGGTPYRL